MRTTLGIGKHRDSIETMSLVLEVGMNSPVRSVSLGEVQEELGGWVRTKRMFATMATELGLVRHATEQELHKIARYELAQKSKVLGYMRHVSYKARPTASMIAKYIRKYLRNVVIVTELGEQVAELLRNMKKLLTKTTFYENAKKT